MSRLRLRFLPLLGAGLMACVSGDPQQKLLRETLRSEDCALGAALYEERLKLPPHAGVVVTNRPQPIPSEAEQASLLLAFSSECSSLVGRARRVIVRCWSDATDAMTTRACNQRF